MPFQNVSFQQAQISNAQQQQLYNYQQMPLQAPQMTPNSLMTNAQRQMNFNMMMNQAPQLNMQIPIQQVAPQRNMLGAYGRTRETMDVE